MRKFWFALFALLMATLSASPRVNAQEPAAPGGSYLQTTPTGQTFLMVPNSPVPPAQPVSFGGGPPDNVTPMPACNDCCEDGWCHRWYGYGGFMYLRSRDSEVAYAVAANGPITPGSSVVQVSPVAVLDQDYQPGFFVGFGTTLDSCSSIGVNYMQLDANTTSSLATSPPNNAVVRSLVAHPSTFNAASDGLFAQGEYDIQYKVLDLEYRQLISGDAGTKFNYLVGVRFANLEQRLNSQFSFNGVQSVNTNVDFYGAGIKTGLEYERISKRGLMVYAKGFASLLPGQFNTTYQQFDDADQNTVNTGWRAGRLVSMLELEVGGGWVSCCGHYRLSAGYLFQAWYNVVQTDEWIHGVQTNNYIDMSSMMSFDGLMARFEYRF